LVRAYASLQIANVSLSSSTAWFVRCIVEPIIYRLLPGDEALEKRYELLRPGSSGQTFA